MFFLNIEKKQNVLSTDQSFQPFLLQEYEGRNPLLQEHLLIGPKSPLREKKKKKFPPLKKDKSIKFKYNSTQPSNVKKVKK